MIKKTLLLLCLGLGLSLTSSFAKPNVLVLYLDDMGYAQPGCYGGKLAPTPNLDSLAANGVRFTNGYVSACICSPSRVGLVTGRYQARSGHDANSGRAGHELLLSETTIAQRMKNAGYTTGIVGKWHLGTTTPEFLPAARGFDFSVGSVDNLGGSEEGRENKKPSFYRGSDFIDDLPGAPVTSPVYAREAVGFMEANKSKPWFLYVAFNAVHSPHVASSKWLEKFAGLPRRDAAYAANIAEADEAIGSILHKTRELNLEENTLVFCVSDNGGASPSAEMGGLRGRKWTAWEGGVRVTWLAQWKGRIPGGRVVSEPVIQLDILPTAVAASGAAIELDWRLDGVNLLPLLEGKTDTLAREALYWRFGVQQAVRHGDWKLIKVGQGQPDMLFNLATDQGEQTDLASAHPERVRMLRDLWDKWNTGNQPPRWEDRRWHDAEARSKKRRE
jgi:arylsulfatase A-like enzyme